MASEQQPHRSYSAVRSLLNCGESYRLEREERVSQRPSSAAIAGRVIHAGTEIVDMEIHRGETDEATLNLLGLTYATEVLDKEIESARSDDYPDPTSWKSYGRATKEKPHGEDIQWFGAVGIPTCLNNYITWRLENPQLQLLTLPSGAVAVEVPFVVHIEDVPVKGYIDRVFVNTTNGTPVVVDIKSGQKPDSSQQLGIYRKALAAGGVELTYGAFIYGLKKGCSVTPDIDLRVWTDEALARVYVAADRQIKAGLFIPHPGEACFHCSVSKHCKFFPSSIL